MVWLFIFLFIKNSNAQSPATYNFADIYDFNVKTVYALYQAKNNHVWIGTDQGLFEFNGTVFNKYINNKYQTEYSNIQEDSQGRIWCNNFSGQIFYIEDKSLELFEDVNQYAYKDGHMMYMFTTAYFPEICIGTNYGYLSIDFNNRKNKEHFQTPYYTKEDYKIPENKDTVYRDNIHLIQPYKNTPEYFKSILNQLQETTAGLSLPGWEKDTTASLFSHDDTFSFFYRKNNDELQHYLFKKDSLKFLFTTRRKEGYPFLFSHKDALLFLYRNRDDKLQTYLYQNDTLQVKLYNDLPKPNTTAVYYHKDIKKYWLGTSDGIFTINSALQPVARSFSFLKGNSVSGIMKDHEGNYWIATLHNGIYIIPSLAIRTVNNSNSSMAQNEIVGMEKVGRDQLVLADNSGNVYQYHISENKLVLLFNIGADTGYMVYNPIKDIIYFHGTDNYYDLKSGRLISKGIKSIKAGIAIDSTHFLMSRGGEAFITNFETSKAKLPMNSAWQKRYGIAEGEGLPNLLLLKSKRAYVNTICKTTNTIYISYSDGLFAYDYKTGEEQQLLYESVPVMSTALHPGKEKGIWTADTKGVLSFILKSKVTPIDTFHTEIRHIREKDSVLFLGTNEGLIRYDLKQKQKNSINVLDGLPSNTITDLVIANDTVFVATLEGLAKVPATYTYKNKVPPEVTLTTLLINGETRESAKILALKTSENNLSFAFNTYALRSQKTFTYAYRMLGVDSTWTVTQTDNVSFAALAPNQYTFQVKAINEDGVESEQIREVQFIIDSPFHQKWWFYMLISLGSIVLVSYLYNYRISTIKKQNSLQQRQEILEKQLVSSTITALKAQMNPHFMFNAMNSIQSLILKGKRDVAYDYLTKLSSLIRENLNMSEKNFVYFTEERKLIVTYLELEKLRFRTGFDYTINHSEAIDDVKIPTMIIQPFIENAIKHGLLHKEGNKKLTIDFHQNDALICVITDNGIGRAASEVINKQRKDKHASFSTKVMERRFALLREYYKLDLGFSYADLEKDTISTGTQVTIKIPYLTDDD